MSTMVRPSPEVRARLEAAIAGRRAPTRAESRARTRLVVAASLVPVFARLALRGLDPAGRPTGYVVVTAASWSAIILAASLWTLGRQPHALGRPRPLLALLALALPASLLAASFVASAAFPEAAVHASCGWGVHGMCAASAILFSIAPASALLWVFRGSDPVKPWASGAALGAVAASWGGLVVAVQCPHAELLHVALGHVAPVATMAFIGAVAGGRLLSLRWIR